PDEESGHVRARNRHRVDDRDPDPRPRHRRREYRLRIPDRPVAVVHGAVRQFRRGGCRRPPQGAGRGVSTPAPRDASPGAGGGCHNFTPSTSLRVGDVVPVEAGHPIPSEGEVIEGIDSVNEAALTGESAPVIRESGGDRSAVTGGTQVLSDWIKVRITAA